MTALDIKNINILDFEIDTTVERLSKITDNKKANIQLDLTSNEGRNSFIKANKDGLLILAADLLKAARAGKSSQHCLNQKLVDPASHSEISFVELLEDEVKEAPAPIVVEKKKMTLKDKVFFFSFLVALTIFIFFTGWIVS